MRLLRGSFFVCMCAAFGALFTFLARSFLGCHFGYLLRSFWVLWIRFDDVWASFRGLWGCFLGLWEVLGGSWSCPLGDSKGSWGDPWIPRRFVDASGTISGKFREISGSQQGVILPSFCASFFHQKINEKLCCFRASLGSLLSFTLVMILMSFCSPFVS